MEGAIEGVECEDWFFCTRPISPEEVEAVIRKA
jgi:peroxiredoxin (alkyl hydroperoxide reductase subunit C)